MTLDLFGIKIGKDSTEYKKDITYKITKQQLLEKLGFSKANFISYNYKEGILTIKGEKE